MLFLVRHAHSDYGPDEMRALSESGQRAAQRVADLLEDRGVAVIVSSPYTRAVQTVQPLADRLGFRSRSTPTCGSVNCRPAPSMTSSDGSRQRGATSIWPIPVGSRARLHKNASAGPSVEPWRPPAIAPSSCHRTGTRWRCSSVRSTRRSISSSGRRCRCPTCTRSRSRAARRPGPIGESTSPRAADRACAPGRWSAPGCRWCPRRSSRASPCPRSATAPRGGPAPLWRRGCHAP